MSDSDTPYCGKCGYQLTGLIESSKCPECGSPIVETLIRPSMRSGHGYRYTSKRRVFGLPLVHIAFGPEGMDRRGKAKGIIAIGDSALGVFAVGWIARGVVAVGGMAFGVASFGGLAVGLLVVFGGLAIGGLASGGGAVGAVANGGLAIGYAAEGGLAIGVYARGGAVRGRHTLGPGANSAEARRFFNSHSWLFGGLPGIGMMYRAVAGIGLVSLIAGSVVVLLMLFWSDVAEKPRE
ncbi:MAG: hypothetical protein IID36_02065 [Planctomycetes bacterium]|nr:hypothetical protein [Planctomycetota bacterium]